MSEPALQIERDGPIAILTMNRPHVKNAIDPEMLCRMADAWEQVDGDDEIRVAILTGAGGDFCAGADLDKLVGRLLRNEPCENEYEERLRENYELIFRGMLRSYRPAKPVVAAIEGSCIAGGVEILQGTDIRVAGDTADEAHRSRFLLMVGAKRPSCREIRSMG